MRRHRSRRRNKQRNIIIISACTILLFMTVGYAAMSTNLEINAKGNVIKQDTLGEDLIESAGVVTSGDGLYKDGYEENVYTYRGSNPNNYVTFNNELWRIISVNISDNTIKIMRNSSFSYKYDGEKYRPDYGYCNDTDIYGCNIWGSNSTLYDINMNPITELVSSTSPAKKYSFPDKEAELNTYLNGTYYNGLNSTAKDMIIDAVYKVGGAILGEELQESINNISMAKWKRKVALIDVTEYVRAGTDSTCSKSVNNSYLYNDCYTKNPSNYMYTGVNNYIIYWTMTPFSSFADPSDSVSTALFTINNIGSLIISPKNSFSVRPVVTLSGEVKITSGDGTQNNSYQLSL